MDSAFGRAAPVRFCFCFDARYGNEPGNLEARLLAEDTPNLLFLILAQRAVAGVDGDSALREQRALASQLAVQFSGYLLKRGIFVEVERDAGAPALDKHGRLMIRFPWEEILPRLPRTQRLPQPTPFPVM